MKHKMSIVRYEDLDIDNEYIVEFLKNEVIELLGSEDRYIHNGNIYERDYKYDNNQFICDADEDSINDYFTLVTIIKHFESKK